MPGEAPRVGLASVETHHGEILQGVFHCEHTPGRVCPGLVTLPVSLRCRARFVPSSSPRLEVRPAGRTKAGRAVRLTLAALAEDGAEAAPGGTLEIESPIRLGLGMGSSTADVVAAVVATLAAHDVTWPPERVAALAVTAEGASDPLAHRGRALLFAHRAGRILEDFGARLPQLVLLGFLTAGGEAVDTLAVPPVDPGLLDCYEELRRRLRVAVADGDAAGVANVATRSAELNQARLPKAELATSLRIAERVDALGVQVSHSGNVASIVLDAEAPHLPDQLDRGAGLLAAAGLESHGTWPTRA